jgi:hypothetical protein
MYVFWGGVSGQIYLDLSSAEGAPGRSRARVGVVRASIQARARKQRRPPPCLSPTKKTASFRGVEKNSQAELKKRRRRGGDGATRDRERETERERGVDGLGGKSGKRRPEFRPRIFFGCVCVGGWLSCHALCLISCCFLFVGAPERDPICAASGAAPRAGRDRLSPSFFSPRGHHHVAQFGRLRQAAAAVGARGIELRGG